MVLKKVTFIYCPSLSSNMSSAKNKLGAREWWDTITKLLNLQLQKMPENLRDLTFYASDNCGLGSYLLPK